MERRSLSSLTYKGSIPEAINEAKKQKKLFVVYISGNFCLISITFISNNVVMKFLILFYFILFQAKTLSQTTWNTQHGLIWKWVKFFIYYILIIFFFLSVRVPYLLCSGGRVSIEVLYTIAYPRRKHRRCKLLCNM